MRDEKSKVCFKLAITFFNFQYLTLQPAKLPASNKSTRKVINFEIKLENKVT